MDVGQYFVLNSDPLSSVSSFGPIIVLHTNIQMESQIAMFLMSWKVRIFTWREVPQIVV